MVPAHTTIQPQLIGLLVVDIDTCHLHGSQSLTSHAETSTSSTTREAHIVGVIGIGHHHQVQAVTHQATEDTTCITMLRTSSQVGVQHESLVHTRFNAEVEDGLLLTILNTRYTSKVTLSVVGLDTIDDIGRQVFQGRLGVARHELFAFHKDLLHFLTINLNRTVVTDLSTRQSFYQFLNHRSLWSTEGIGIIDKGIGLQCHLRCMSRHCGTLQHDGIRSQ